MEKQEQHVLEPNRIGVQLAIAFGLLVSILVGVGWLGLARMRSMNEDLEAIVGKRWAKVDVSRRALNYSAANNRITMEVFILDDQKEIEQLLRRRAENTEEISAAVNELEQRGAESGKEVFKVKDTGIGISHEHQRAIFEPFSQADGSATRRHGGTGLGLTIAGRLVELMQGKIWMESEPGEGSTFHFSARLKLPERPSSQSSPRPLHELQGILALVVDGNSVNRRVLRGMLSHWGMNAADVEDGAAALQVMRIAKDIGHPFSVVLLDGHMRGMDGFSIAEQIKKDPSLGAATIMMLTSVGHVGDAARCRELGISAYLVKPIRLSELVNALCIALERTAGRESTPLVTRHTLREAKDRLPLPA